MDVKKATLSRGCSAVSSCRVSTRSCSSRTRVVKRRPPITAEGDVQPVQPGDALTKLDAREADHRGQGEGLEKIEFQVEHGRQEGTSRLVLSRTRAGAESRVVSRESRLRGYAES
jgi:hypothetical protein